MEICEGNLHGFPGLMNLMLCKISYGAVSLMQYLHFHIFLSVNFWNTPLENVAVKTILHSNFLPFSPNSSLINFLKNCYRLIKKYRNKFSPLDTPEDSVLTCSAFDLSR